MPSITSVVTPVRLAQGLTYADFVAQAAVNQDKFVANDKTVPLTEDDMAFYTKDVEYITHWKERSASAHAGLGAAMSEAKTKLSLPQSATFTTLEGANRQALLQEVIARVGPFADQWRRDAIREIRQVLANA